MSKVFIVSLLFIISSCSSSTLSVLHNQEHTDSQMLTTDPSVPSASMHRQCKPGFTMKMNKHKKECIHR